MSLKNEKTLPKVYYGLHMMEGVAEYADEPGKEPYRILIGEDCLKDMDISFQGKPVYVNHVNEVNLKNIKEEADGYVSESFYLPCDGKHWVKFIVVSDEAHQAIQNGWRLSNAYVPKQLTLGGLWHGVEYAKEITMGEYEHLAIVNNPRYEESIILTPEQFKAYCEEKELALQKIANSKTEKGAQEMKLSFFKKQKVENALDPEMSVVLPKSGKEVTITQLVNEADEKAMKKEDMADLSHKVKIHDGSEMSVGDLVSKHKELQDALDEMKKKQDDSGSEQEDTASEDKQDAGDKDDEEAKKKALQLADHEEKEIEEAKKKNEADAAAAKKAEAKEKADKLRNAHNRAAADEVVTVEFSGDQVERGKARYGSK